jgi:hypothetical protein
MYQQSKDLVFQAKATEEQIELLQEQQRLEEFTTHACFVDTSVSDTIYNLVCLAADDPGTYLKQSNNFQRKFKVPEKRFYHLKVKAMAETQQWKHLYELSLERKQPIGFKPFAEACLREGNPLEAERYITRIPQFEERFDMFLANSNWQQAAEVASKMKDLDRMQQLRMVCTDAAVSVQIDQMMQQLS